MHIDISAHRLSAFLVLILLPSTCLRTSYAHEKLASTAAQPHSCQNANDHSGANAFACLDVSGITPQSYCLRSRGPMPVHIRKAADDDTFLTQSKVVLHVPTSSIMPSSCTATLHPHPSPLKDGDWLLITRTGAGAGMPPYQMQIIRVDGSLVFKDWIPLVPSANHYYLKTPDAVGDFNWFVMLGDDIGSSPPPKNNPRQADMQRIEKYYFVEVFPSANMQSDFKNQADWNACYSERPDSTPADSNFSRWVPSAPPAAGTCVAAPAAQQLGQGSGGQNYP